MAKLQPLHLILQGVDKATGVLAKVERRIGTFGRRTASIGRAITTGLSLPIAGIGIAASKGAADFEDSMAKIVGLVGESTAAIAGLRQGVFNISRATGKGPGELADALFDVESAGFHGDRALEVLNAAAKAAASGLGETSVVADASTSALNAYEDAGLKAADAVGILVATVREGKASADAFAPVLGEILPLASNLGVSFNDVGAALAAMTRVSGNAALATTGLKGILAGILKPAREIEKAAPRLFAGLRKELREKGLLAVLETLRTRFGDNQVALGHLFPRVEGLSGLLSLLGQNADVVRGIFKRLAEAGENDLVQAFLATTTAGRQFRQAWADIQIAGIELGSVILPLVVPWVRRFSLGIEDLTKWFGGLSPWIQKTLIFGAGLIAILGPIVVAVGLVAQAVAGLVGIWPALVAGFGAIASVGAVVVGAVAAIAAAGTLLYRKWQPFRNFVDATVDKLSDFWTFLKQIAALVGQQAAGPLGELWHWLSEETTVSNRRPAPVTPASAAQAAAGQTNQVNASATVRLELPEGVKARTEKMTSDTRHFELVTETGSLLLMP